MLHRLVVSVEELAIEVTRVPVDKHATEIEYRYRTIGRHVCHSIELMLSGLVAVDGFHGESGEADGYVLGAAFFRSGIADPLASVSDYGFFPGGGGGNVFFFVVR